MHLSLSVFFLNLLLVIVESHAATFLTKQNVLSTFGVRNQIDGKDPTCKTGIRSLNVGEAAEVQQVCCPTYCKECGDHPTCKQAFGANTEDSTNACCASQVVALPATKSCDESLPPCKLTQVTFDDPPKNTAGDDCGNARDEMNDCLDAAVAPVAP